MSECGSSLESYSSFQCVLLWKSRVSVSKFQPGLSLESYGFDCITEHQARNQIGIPGGAKSFPRGAQNFWTMSNIFKLCPMHFSRGAEIFLRGTKPPSLWACWAYVNLIYIPNYLFVFESLSWITYGCCSHNYASPWDNQKESRTDDRLSA